MKFVQKGKTYYTSKKEAVKVKQKGEKIYFDPFANAYYIINFNKEANIDSKIKKAKRKLIKELGYNCEMGFSKDFVRRTINKIFKGEFK